MAILVVCPSCKSRFQVSDKYAGKSGACPKCKGTITVPSAAPEVTIHGPSEFSSGGRNAAGQLVLKPIARKETRFSPATAAIIGGAALVVLLLAWAGGRVQAWEHLPLRLLGLLIITPPLMVAFYWVLYDDELEPHQGKPLYLRVAVSALAYIVLWGIFDYVVGRGLTGEIWSWLFVVPPFLILGGLTALACFDLDFGSGCLHYAFYVLVIILLRWVAGMDWIWQLPPPPLI
jgi:hypothetical protein